MDEKSMMNFDKITTDLKKLLDSFKEKLSNLNFKKQHSFLYLVKKYSDDEEFIKKLASINNLMNDIADKLEVLDSFENEFHNFLSIQNMIRYITGDIGRYFCHLTFVRELTSSFYDLINTKIRLIENNEYESYNEIYKTFDDYLFKQEEFFYLNIFEPTHKYDDLIDEITKILW